MHKPVMVKSIVAVVAIGASLFAAKPALALGVGGWEGKAAGAATSTCFIFNTGGVQNTCGQTNFILPLRANSGSKTVALSTFNPGGGTFQCTLFSMTQTGISTAGTTVSPGTGNVVSNLSVTVPGNGSMYIVCNMNTNGAIWNANYNE